MPRNHEVRLPDELTAKLDRLQSHVRKLAMLRGGGMLVFVSAAVIAVGLLMDFRWELSVGMRMALLAGFALMVSVVFGWLLLRPLLRRLQAAELAALVERAHPKLMERLSSTIELNDPAIPEAHKGSAYMRRRLMRQTLRSVGPLNFTDCISPKRAVRWLAVGAVTLLLLLAPFFWSPAAYGLLWTRFFQPWGNYDSAGNMYFQVEHGDRVVARGSDVDINVKLGWHRTADERPQTVWLNWVDVTGADDSRSMEFDKTSEVYMARIPHVFSAFDYHVSAGRSRSRNYRIDVVEAPQIVEVTLEAEPPGYTGQTSARYDGVIGTIRVFERSRLLFRMAFNKPIDQAKLSWLIGGVGADPIVADHENSDDSRSAQDDDESALPFVLSQDRRSARLETTAVAAGRFEFVLTDEHGLHNSAELERILEVVPDRPPELTLLGSGRPQRARPSDVFSLNVAAIDDVGVDALELHFKIQREAPHVVLADDAKLGVPAVSHEFSLDLEPLNLAHGMVVTYRVRAADQRPVPGPNETWSEPRILTIDLRADPLGSNEVADRQQHLREILQGIRADLQENHKQVDDLRNEAEADIRMKVEFSRDAELQPLSAAQLDLTQRLEQLALRFAEHPLYANLTQAARQVAREDLSQTAEQTKRVAEMPLEEKASALSQIERQLGQADNKLADLEKKFDELARIERELLEINRLAQQFEKEAERLRAEALARQKQREDPPANETPAQRQQREAQWARRQQVLDQKQQDLAGLDEQLKDLLQRRPELVEAARQNELNRLAELSQRALEIAQPQDLLADALRQEARQTAEDAKTLIEQQAEILRKAQQLTAPADPPGPKQPMIPFDPDMLRRALDELKAGNLTGAVERQQDATRELDRLAQELKKNDQRPADLQQAAKLAQQQRSLSRQVAQLQQQRSQAADRQKGETQNDAPQPEDLTHAPLAQAQQRRLARQAAQLALDAARQTGVDSAAAQQVADFARQSNQVAQQATAGHMHNAQNTAQQAAITGQQAARQLDQEGRPETEELAQQAQQLARQQAQLGEQFGRLSQSPNQRKRAQQSGQQQLQRATEHLSKQFAEAAQRLHAEPVNLSRPAEQAQAAQQSTEAGREAMQQAAQQIGQDNVGAAAQLARQAAESLRQAAQQVAQATSDNGQPQSPVPQNVGEQIAEAQRRLQQARDQLTQAQKQKNLPDQSGQNSQQPPNPLAQSAQNLQQAADALAQASRQLQQQQGGHRSQQAGQSQQSQPNASEGGDGQGSMISVDLAQLEAKLMRLAGRDWGQLPGHLQTEILQAAQKKPNDDYAKLIKFYFQEIAKTQKPAEPSTER